MDEYKTVAEVIAEYNARKEKDIGVLVKESLENSSLAGLYIKPDNDGNYPSDYNL